MLRHRQQAVAATALLGNHKIRFVIGQDSHGTWIVHDLLGRVGGLFSSHDAARHFAFSECDHDRAAIRDAEDGELLAFDSAKLH